MTAHQISLILAGLLALTASVITAEDQAPDSNTWEPPYNGADPNVLYLPDANAVYWRYGWKRKPGDTGGLRITGEFPEARYFSYNVYDDDTKMSLGSFSDAELKGDSGAVNPFQGGGGEKISGSYTISILPEGVAGEDENVLRFPDSVNHVSILLRFYLPEGDLKGRRPLPVISLYAPGTGELSAAPPSKKIPKVSKEEVKKYLLPMAKKMVAEIEHNPADVLRGLEHRTGDSLKVNELICKQVVAEAFTRNVPGEPLLSFNFQTEGTYPNKDNYYLTMPVVRTNESDVLLLKFKAPRFPASRQEYPESEVRYFSLSQGDEITYNHATIIDRDFTVHGDGFIRVLIGADALEIRETAAESGFDFMPWKVHDKMLLVYRHMMPRKDFGGGIDKVPVFEKGEPARGQSGTVAIGDYAPIGKFLSLRDLLAGEGREF